MIIQSYGSVKPISSDRIFFAIDNMNPFPLPSILPWTSKTFCVGRSFQAIRPELDARKLGQGRIVLFVRKSRGVGF